MRFEKHAFNAWVEKPAFYHPLKSLMLTYYNPCIKIVFSRNVHLTHVLVNVCFTKRRFTHVTWRALLDLHVYHALNVDRFKTRKIWRRFIWQYISFHKKIANDFRTDGQWQKIGKPWYIRFFLQKMSHSYSWKQDWYFDIFMYILWHPSSLIKSDVIVNMFKQTLSYGTQN